MNVTSTVHDFTIIATSEGNNSRADLVSVDISVNQYYGVTLEMPLTSQRVFPDTAISYPVRIINQGNGEDTFDLYTGSDWGAEIRIDNSPTGEVFLGAFREVEAELIVEIPNDVSVGDFKELPLTAISQGDSSVSASITSNTSVGIMMAENAVVGVLPGNNASFHLEFLNPTNQTDTFTFSIESGNPGWDSSLYPASISLESASKGNGWINLTVPNTAEPDTSYLMTFAFGNAETLDSINVIVEILPLSGAHIWSDNEEHIAYADPRN